MTTPDCPLESLPEPLRSQLCEVPPALAIRVALDAMTVSALTLVAVACLCGAAVAVKLTADFLTR